jgi:hypothetical protein
MSFHPTGQARLRSAAGFLAVAYILSAGVPSAAAPPQVLEQVSLPDGRTAAVYSGGVTRIEDAKHHTQQTRTLLVGRDGPGGSGLPSKAEIVRRLTESPYASQGYPPNVAIVVLRGAVTPAQTVTVADEQLSAYRRELALGAPALAPSYTSDAATNTALAAIGTDQLRHLFTNVRPSLLRSTSSLFSASAVNAGSAYLVHFRGARVEDAVKALLALPGVAYASPNYYVGPAHTTPQPLPQLARLHAQLAAQSLPASFGRSQSRSRRGQLRIGGATLPTNYALTSSFQTLLNTPGLDAAAAYDVITNKYNQLPGTGEIITNVSEGDLDDASETSPSDPCSIQVLSWGPTTILSGGQRYLDWPSMPLIPTYTSTDNGTLSGSASVCDVDPFDTEIGLDFSMMAPLPHNQQRSGNPGSGDTDLLGVAPGATYRLVVPASFTPTIADIDGALLGAGQQSPAPNVITASLGFGYDGFGFPSRYLEDDPLTESIVASLVKNGIVVCISANDGLRSAFTNAAVSPSGGSAPTNVVPAGATPSALSDVAFSTTPSLDPDSGAIDAGATTLDDIFAAPPQYAPNASLASQHAFAETRWTGYTAYSSGFGSRVNLSAPGDNVMGFMHSGSTAQSVAVVNDGGTSASSPEIAAAAAVVLQVARLTGHPLGSPSAVRSFLASTGTAVPAVPQSDVVNGIGPQVDLGRAVSTLFANAGIAIPAAVGRVAVEQRRDGDYGFGNPPFYDGLFATDTNPTAIDLAGPPVNPAGGDNTLTAADQLAWITIAPDWEGLPAGSTYKFTLQGSGTVLATTPWVRMLPAQLLGAAGLPLQSMSNRTVTFTYSALSGSQVVASTTIPLTFGPLSAAPLEVLAPTTSGVATSNVISVNYNLSNAADQSNPQLIVSYPGRVNPGTGTVYNAAYTIPLQAGSVGTADIPTSALHGGGIYGIGIHYGTYIGPHVNTALYSDFAFVRYAPTSTVRPAAPLLADGVSGAHTLPISYGEYFKVSWDVRNISGASGAILEISQPGPGFYPSFNTFNNPNGSIRDSDGTDGTSIYYTTLPSTHGTESLNPQAIGLVAGPTYTLRVFALSGSQIIGEGGEVSSVTENGLGTVDGGEISGIGVNRYGNDGYLTSVGFGTSSVEPFSQSKTTISIADSSTAVQYGGPWSILDSDISLLSSTNPQTGAIGYNFLNPTSSGTISSTVGIGTNLTLYGAADNQETPTEAFTTCDTNGNCYVGTLNVLTGSINLFNESAFLQIVGTQGGITEDPSANVAYVPANDSNCPTEPAFAAVNLTTGAATLTCVPGSGPAGGLALDPNTHILAILPEAQQAMILYKLSNGTQTTVAIPQSSYFAGFNNLSAPAVDLTNHLVLAINGALPDYPASNNSQPGVVVVNETTGTYTETEGYGGAAFGGDFVPQDYLVVNGTNRKGWIQTNYSELTPFSY